MRTIRSGLLLALCLALAACAVLNRQVIEGSGTMTTETRAVTDFTEIVLAGSGDVVVMIGDDEGVVIEAEDNLLPYLTADVRGGELVLGVKPFVQIVPSESIRYTVTVSQLEGVSISGSGRVQVPQVAEDWLKFELTGSGTIAAVGSVDEFEAVLTGSGSVDAGELQAHDARVSLPGSGNLVVWATERLEVTIAGSGNVSYYGSPEIHETVTGSGLVQDLGNR
jgi:hypothetical protein